MVKKKKIKKNKARKPSPKSSSKKHAQSVLELVLNTNSHPTADWICRKLKRKFKSLSLKAVLGDLHNLKEEGYIWELECGKGPSRFNSVAHSHYHFVCNSCQNIYDIRIPPMRQLDDRIMHLTGFRVFSHRLTLFGLCDTCKLRKETGNQDNKKKS